MSTSRGLAALLILLALWSCAPAAAPPTEPPPHAPTEIQGPAWPTSRCEPGADQPSSWRPRQLDDVGPVPPVSLLMPVDGALVADVYPSFGAPRSGGRLHEGVDIMAPRGTPVRAAAPGYVVRVDPDATSVTTVGDGGIRYFYTHFDSLPAGLAEGQYVDVDTVIGYVGNTGNAAATDPHLHFGVYYGGLGEWCGWLPLDPLPWLVDR